MDSSASHRPQSRAFTLIELLVVIGIIAILMTIAISVGVRVSGSGKIRQTEETLKALEQTLSEYIAASGGMPKPYVVDPRPQNQTYQPSQRYMQPVFDGVNHDGIAINSVGLFLAQCREHPSVMETLKSLPTSILKEYDPDGPGNDGDYRQQTLILTALDGWGRPIRYVHPAFSGVRTNASNGFLNIDANELLGPQKPILNGIVYDRWGMNSVRRNGPTTPGASSPRDSDGGIAQGNRPYFYSAGPDGDPGTTDDNVYINAPKFSRD